MKISIQTIAFNAISTLPKNMLQKNIEQWLGVADEIIIVEGATWARTGRFDGETRSLTPDGKSTDNTREILEEMKAKHSQIKLIFGDGFWDGKTAMCNAAAKIATGDYLWQCDNDEFYHEKDVPIILNLLEKHHPDAVHFYAYHFWGGYNTVMDNNQPWGNDIPWKRIFKHMPGSHWISHEPPDYQLADGTICNRGRVITRDDTYSLGIKLYHYSYVEKTQVDFKAVFYANPAYLTLWDHWKANNDTAIFGACTSKFTGTHPSIILK